MFASLVSPLRINAGALPLPSNACLCHRKGAGHHWHVMTLVCAPEWHQAVQHVQAMSHLQERNRALMWRLGMRHRPGAGAWTR